MAKLPLEGIRVVGITPIWAGPFCVMLLADWGAQVIKVEDRFHWMAATRGAMPHPFAELEKQRAAGILSYLNKSPGERPWNQNVLFNVHARNQLSMTVDLRKPEGKDVYRRLIQVSDVVIESNAAGTMDRVGVGYEQLKEWKPDIIMVSLPGFGSYGPYRDYRGLGAHMEGFVGHTYIRGYHDMDPAATTTVFHYDATAGASCAFAAVMALHHRNRTGKGQWLDMAGAETTMPQLGDLITEYTMNGRLPERLGNRHRSAAPCGCYLAKGAEPGAETPGGDDKWVNITVNNDEEWEGFCRAIGNPPWTRDKRFADCISRYQNQDELDKLIGEWTRQHDKYEIFHLMQREGVPCAPVLDSRDSLEDPHLKERGFYEQVTQADCGTHFYPGIAFKMSKMPNSIRMPACLMGEHNEYVYKEIIKVSDEEYADLVEKGHIGMDYAPGVSL